VSHPRTDWNQWIKTVGDIPFEYHYEATSDGYKISFDASIAKQFPRDIKKFKQVFHKAACCLECRVCETNCRNGCISFAHGLEISGCLHCGQCHEIDDGCLAFHSLRTPTGGGNMKEGSINSFANHAPKLEWVRDFFEQGNDYWEFNGLGPNQIPMFKRFLREAGLIDEHVQTKALFDLVQQLGPESNTSWGLIVANLAYNAQFKWYINNMDVGTFYDREIISDLLINEGVKKNDATSIINAYKRFCELPIGTTLGWGSVLENGRQIDSLVRSKCIITDNRVILYSLYKFSEKCNDYREFTLAWLMNDAIDRDGISPTRIFGLDYEDMKSILLGLSARYPEYIDATFTNDLDKITIKDKTSEDVLNLFKEEM
jgi:phosphoadenosine phosphosulfate reductase